MATENNQLGNQLDHFINDLIMTGRYSTKNEVIREGLRLLQEREQLRLAKLDEVRRAFREGLNSGYGNNAEDIFNRLEKKYSEMLS